MNILFINSISKGKFGGGEKWMVRAAQGLSAARHRVVLASKKDSRILQAATEAGVRTKVITIRADFSPLTTLRIARYLRKENIQILVCNLNKDVRVAGLAARFAGTPAVIARHGVLLCGKKWKHKLTLRYLVDGILTNTDSIKRQYLEYGWFDDSFVKVLYNGVEDISDTVPYDFNALHPGKKVLFSAGRLSEQKGFDYLIEAAAILAERRNDLAFVVAGQGAQERKLKEHALKLGLADSFQFIGYKQDIRPYLKGCTLFVLSSRFEGMPNVVMEAMATGKAVIATDVNGVRELMVDGETGLIVPPQDPLTLAEAIQKIIDDESVLRTYGENGLRRVRGHFTLSQMITALESYFFEKCEEKSTEKKSL